MKKVNILLDSVDKVKSFVNIVAKYSVDFDLISGRYVVDAKSIMGVLSMYLAKPLELCVYCASESEWKEIQESISLYIV